MTKQALKILLKGPPYRQAQAPLTWDKWDIPQGPTGNPICRCGCNEEIKYPWQNFVDAEHELAFYLATNWSVIRKAVYQRDHGKCAHCGIFFDEDSEKWQIHHIVPRSKGEDNRLDNLMTLCEPCHQKEHGCGIKKRNRKEAGLGSGQSMRAGAGA